MAIDSAEKRKSAAGVGFWVVGPGVTPNSSKDVEWRQQAGWGYSGISAGTIVVSVPPKFEGLTRNVGRFLKTILLACGM